MQCKCELPERKEIHDALYAYGVCVTICRVTSSSSVKKVPFLCNQCNTQREDKVCHILDKQGVCSHCIDAQSDQEKKEFQRQMKDRIVHQIHNSSYSKREIYTTLKEETPSLTESIYDAICINIPPETWLERPIDYSLLLSSHTQKHICHECTKPIPNMKEGSIRTWCGEELCDLCWAKHEDDRNELWDHVNTWKGIHDVCEICKTTRQHPGVRFQFDHRNMFEKGESICTMVMRGASKEDIQKELELCQYVCLSCHHYITEIENLLPFTQIKKSLNKKRNDGILDEETYEQERVKWCALYETKMNDVYKDLTHYVYQKQLEEAQDNCPYCFEPILESDVNHENILINESMVDNIHKQTLVPMQQNCGTYSCEKCHNKVHYDCFQKHKVFQMRNTDEYKDDPQTYDSETEDLEDTIPCPNCRHENGWYRHGIGIVSMRKNRTENPAHIEYQIREEHNMSAKAYLNHIKEEQREELLKRMYENGQTIL